MVIYASIDLLQYIGELALFVTIFYVFIPRRSGVFSTLFHEWIRIHMYTGKRRRPSVYEHSLLFAIFTYAFISINEICIYYTLTGGDLAIFFNSPPGAEKPGTQVSSLGE